MLAILAQFLMFAELLALIEMLLIDGPLWAVAPLAALAALPAIVEVEAGGMRPAVPLLLIAAAGLWIAALVVPRASAERPLSFSIDYFRDADRKTASWGVATKQAPLPDGFPGHWRKGVLPYNGRTRWISPAPLVTTPVPAARLVASEPDGAGRRIRILSFAGRRRCRRHPLPREDQGPGDRAARSDRPDQAEGRAGQGDRCAARADRATALLSRWCWAIARRSSPSCSRLASGCRPRAPRLPPPGRATPSRNIRPTRA